MSKVKVTGNENVKIVLARMVFFIFVHSDLELLPFDLRITPPSTSLRSNFHEKNINFLPGSNIE